MDMVVVITQLINEGSFHQYFCILHTKWITIKRIPQVIVSVKQKSRGGTHSAQTP